MKFLLLIFILIDAVLVAQPPRMTIMNGARLNSNNNTANINLNGDICWVNNTAPANINLSNVTVKFMGSGLQYIGGSQSSPFYNLRIAKTGSGSQLDVYLDQHISVNNQLYMESGYLDLRNYNVTLSSTASLVNEAASRRVKATNRPNYSTAGTEGEGDGYLTTTRTNPSDNVANLGLDFTPASNLGNTEIRRGHKRLYGSGSFTGNRSASRYYRLIPTTMSTLTVNKFYYLVDGTPELFVHPEANLQMFQEVQFYWGGAPGPVYWQPRTTTPVPASDYVSSTTTTSALNYILITLGSTTTPLPVEYLSFYGLCKEGVNTIYWQTASEINNYGFIVEKSPDAEQWSYLTFVPGQGTVNAVTSYQVTDESPFSITYYRLKQMDNDASFTYSSVISVHCSDNNSYNEDIFPVIPSNGGISVVINGIPGELKKLLFTNVLGQQLIYKKFILQSPVETLQFFENLNTTGIFYITLIGANKKITKPILYQP